MNNSVLQNQQNNQEWTEEYEGQLAIDVFQTNDAIILKAPIAGVKKEDLEISITDDVINIKGERRRGDETGNEIYLSQECYWGPFSRSYILPVAVEHDKVNASLKSGILTVKLPKLEKSKTKLVEIGDEE